MNSDWNFVIGCSLLCIAGKLFLEHLHRLRKVEPSKIGTSAGIFGIVMLSTLAFVGPDQKISTHLERSDMEILQPELSDNDKYNKIVIDVKSAYRNHGKPPSEDHVAYKGNWVTVQEHHRLLAGVKKGAK